MYIVISRATTKKFLKNIAKKPIQGLKQNAKKTVINLKEGKKGETEKPKTNKINRKQRVKWQT